MKNTVTKLSAERATEAIDLRARLKATQNAAVRITDSTVAANEGDIVEADADSKKPQLLKNSGEQLAAAFKLDLVKDQHGAIRARYMAGDRLAVNLVDSEDVEDLVTDYWLQIQGSKGLKDGVKTAITKLRLAGKASKTSVRTMLRVGSRTNEEGDKQYLLDLGTPDGQMVVADEHGWQLEKNTTEPFLTPDGACVAPVRFKSAVEAYDYLSNRLEQAGVPSELCLLVCVAIVCMLRDDMPYILLEFIGSAGSGKTTLALLITQSIDPTGSGRLVSCGVNKMEIGAVGSKRHILTIDNVSALSRESQDLLCKLPYGVTFASRKLYTNYGVAEVTVQKPTIITSVAPAVTQTDLQTRRLDIRFKARQVFARDVMPSESERGLILGACLTLLHAGLKQEKVSPVTQSRHRMAQYAMFGEAIARALGHEAGAFDRLYSMAKKKAAAEYAVGDHVAFAIDKFLRHQQKQAIETDEQPTGVQIRQNRGFIIKRSNGTYLAGYTPKGLRLGAKQVFMNLPAEDRFNSSNGYTYPETDRAMALAVNRLISSILPDLGYRAKEESLGSERNKEKLYVFAWRADDE